MAEVQVIEKFVNGVRESFTVEGLELNLGERIVDVRSPTKGETYILRDDPTTRRLGGNPFIPPPPTAIIIVDDVEKHYGKPFNQLDAPEGYDFTGEFRTPESDDEVLGKYGHNARMTYYTGDAKRLILKKRERIVFEIVGRDRIPEVGEYYTDSLEESILGPFAKLRNPLRYKYILRRTEG